MSYVELSVEERATIQIGYAQGFSLRRIAPVSYTHLDVYKRQEFDSGPDRQAAN